MSSGVDTHGKYLPRECWVGGVHCRTLKEGETELRRQAMRLGIKPDYVSYWTLVNAFRQHKTHVFGIEISTLSSGVPGPEEQKPRHLSGEPLLASPCTHRFGANSSRYE
jgi:hypothetical protein